MIDAVVGLAAPVVFVRACLKIKRLGWKVPKRQWAYLLVSTICILVAYGTDK